ncbi:MAG TPA: hydrogenase expression/formation protein HypE [Polyangia bacterium]|jgi:hydrogenase expression/formation protein HypE|nr:hydrogenase expression/formation protein HypE [Polyangia bacterium]
MEVPSLFGACPAPRPETERVLLAHGSGGLLTSQLIEEMVLPAFRNPALELLDDQAVLPFGAGGERIAFTTDSYVVTPLFFPGGDIGELAVNGTINDLAMGGARPVALSLAFILEEGLPFEELRRVIESARRAAAGAGVPIVTGDTKVVGRGNGDKIFINTSGIGLVPAGVHLSSSRVAPGDVILLSGAIGDHGATILAEREGLALGGALASDTAALHELSAEILRAAPGTHAMRDPTRGGLATVLVEIASRRKLGVDVDERSVPVHDAVRGACELYGLDPLLLANEGKLVAFVPAAEADQALAAMRAHPLGCEAARIGYVTGDGAGLVTLRTPLGGRRILDLPYAEPLPRIC